MNLLKKKLEKFGNIGVSIVGAGLMGSSLVSQLKLIKNMKTVVHSSRNVESVLKAFKMAGIDDDEIVVTNNLNVAEKAIKEGKYVATDNNELVYLNSGTHCVVECTGDTNCGAEIAYNSLINKKHVVSLNVEADVVVGHILKKVAKENGVIYSGTAGDEPGAILEIFDFADFLGFEILAAGKGKNNKLDFEANPETLEAEAIEKGVSPRMLTSFVDGTNTMIELNAVCNATGLVPDVVGCHKIESSAKELAEKFSTKDEGGLLNNYGIVDFVMGVAPGVFVIVRSSSDIITSEMKYLKMGDGPNFTIYRPYHLTSIETPLTIAKAVIDNEAHIEPRFEKPIAETVAVAKRDIKAGERLDGIGGFTVYGTLTKYDHAKEKNLLPIGLISGNTIAKNPIQKGSFITFDDVKVDNSTFINKLRKIQETN